MSQRLPKAAALAVAILFGSVTHAGASDFTISPTSIVLTNEPAADVTITNTGSGTVRISVRAYAWSQTPDQAEKLEETDKIVYYPEIFVLLPGAAQRIRVGVAGTPTSKEQAYRLIISELPPSAASGGSATGVTFVGRMDMPVFVPPGNSIPQTSLPKIESLAVEHGRARAVLSNAGSVHLRQSTIAFAGTDAAGNVIWRDTKQPFYILANGVQNVDEVIPPSICSRLRSIAVRWTLRDGLGTVTSSANVASCK
jgi:fimbrial chaperone protein